MRFFFGDPQGGFWQQCSKHRVDFNTDFYGWNGCVLYVEWLFFFHNKSNGENGFPWDN